jgi:hypothetical protein
MDIKFKRSMLEHIDQATASKELSSIAGVSEFEVRGISEDDMSVGGTISNLNVHSNNINLNKLESYSPHNSAGGGSSKGHQKGQHANMEHIMRAFK